MLSPVDMFTTMALPVFSDDNSLPGHRGHGHGHGQGQYNGAIASASISYQPSVSSPLSSSPIRATTTTTPPLSPCDPNARPREIQSSPIRAPAQKPVSTNKFSSRPTRPNPVVNKREAAQESRRKLFLKNVRQRADDQRWEARGGDQELLKLEWFSLNKDLRRAKNADLDGIVFDSDIEDAARLREEVMSKPLAVTPDDGLETDPDADAMMVDALEQEAQAEFEALASSIPNEQQQSPRPPDSPHWSDDEDYDALFMDYLSQGQQSQSRAPASSGEMDLA